LLLPGLENGLYTAYASIDFGVLCSLGLCSIRARHATVLYDHQMMKAAAPIYEEALRLLPANEPGNKWRRVAIDQAAMASGISGDIQKARMLLNAAVQADPAYPLNYYNLACADAEEGNAADAKLHLQQAFDWKANVIFGENLPDPRMIRFSS
jgi:tetratricopeptide (TPR) repeat protein